MSILFPNIFETKQYVAYPSNRCFTIFSTNETDFGAIRISSGHAMKVRRKQASWLAHVFRAIMYPQCPC